MLRLPMLLWLNYLSIIRHILTLLTPLFLPPPLPTVLLPALRPGKTTKTTVEGSAELA
jgi:hypothetical protein